MLSLVLARDVWFVVCAAVQHRDWRVVDYLDGSVAAVIDRLSTATSLITCVIDWSAVVGLFVSMIDRRLALFA